MPVLVSVLTGQGRHHRIRVTGEVAGTIGNGRIRCDRRAVRVGNPAFTFCVHLLRRWVGGRVVRSQFAGFRVRADALACVSGR